MRLQMEKKRELSLSTKKKTMGEKQSMSWKGGKAKGATEKVA